MEVEEYTDTPPEVVGMVFALKILTFLSENHRNRLKNGDLESAILQFEGYSICLIVERWLMIDQTVAEPQLLEKKQKKIVDFVLTNRFTTAADIYRNKGLNTHDLTSQTIRNVLKDEGLKAFKPVIVNCINEGNKQTSRRKGIERLDWPAQSPDLNPIENLWAIIKDKI